MVYATASQLLFTKRRNLLRLTDFEAEPDGTWVFAPVHAAGHPQDWRPPSPPALQNGADLAGLTRTHVDSGTHEVGTPPPR